MSLDLAAYLRFRPVFARVVEPKDLIALDAKVISGTVQLWTGEAGAIVTEVDGDRINTLIVGGDQTEIVEKLRPQAEEWARAQGLKGVIADGRKGWRKRLARFGYRFSNGSLRKDF